MKSKSFLATKERLLLILGIILIAFNLRPALTSLGPLIGLIRIESTFSNSLLGLITTLPLLVFALLSPLVPSLARYLGNEKALFAGLLILALGIVVRSIPMVGSLFVGTLLIGVGIVIGNVLLPSLIKDRLPKEIGKMTGLYSTAMVGFAALASGVSVPLAERLKGGWRAALGFWMITAVLAIIIWLPQLKYKGQVLTYRQKGLWTSPLAWQVTLFMGLQSFCFYIIIAWLPEILVSYGTNISQAGWLLAFNQFISIPGALWAPIVAERMTQQRKLVLGIGLLYLIGISCMLFNSNFIVLTLGTLILGFGQGASVSLAFTFFVLRTRNAWEAAGLSGMAQACGYLLAALGPLLIGFLFDATQQWTWPLLVLLLASSVMILAGWGAGRNQYVEFEKK
ncbi:MAG TPA: MFS transporter [Clostridia bacterium]|nr:MFS transporter [Clostridia bacterium]